MVYIKGGIIMKIEDTEIYIAEDGKRFFTLAECEEYEQLQADRIKLRTAAEVIQNYCRSINCENCFLANEYDDCRPCDWEF